MPDLGNQSIDDLVDQVLQQAPEAVGAPMPAHRQWVRLEPEDHRELIALFSRIMAQYLEPISQLIGMVRCGDRAREALESFRDVMGPILLLTETIRATEQAEITRAFLAHIEVLSRHRGPFTYRHLEPLNCLFDQLLQSLDPVVRDRYLATCFYQRNTNPLLEALRRIRFMGPRRLQRLYAVGLVTADSISRASVQEIMEVSGLSLQLAQAVIDATRTFTEQQRRERVRRVRELCRELEGELGWFTGDGREQLREVWSELTALTAVTERARALGGAMETRAKAPSSEGERHE